MRKPSSYQRKRRSSEDLQLQHSSTCVPPPQNYKELDVFVISAGMQIQRVGKGKFKRRPSEVDLRGVTFPDDLNASFNDGLIDESYVWKENDGERGGADDQQVPNKNNSSLLLLSQHEEEKRQAKAASKTTSSKRMSAPYTNESSDMRTNDNKDYSRNTSDQNRSGKTAEQIPLNNEEAPEHLLFSQYVEDELPGEEAYDFLPDFSKTSPSTNRKYSDLGNSIRVGKFTLTNPIPKTPLLKPGVGGGDQIKRMPETPLIIPGGGVRTVIQETPNLIPGGAASVQKTPLLLSAKSPFIGNKQKAANERKNLQVVPQTPFLGNSINSPSISGLVHRKNSGFQVPETPMVCLGQKGENVTTIVKETPLLPRIG